MTIHIDKMQEIVEVLNLKQDRDGYFHTTWGKKTLEGLRATLENLLNSEVKA